MNFFIEDPNLIYKDICIWKTAEMKPWIAVRTLNNELRRLMVEENAKIYIDFGNKYYSHVNWDWFYEKVRLYRPKDWHVFLHLLKLDVASRKKGIFNEIRDSVLKPVRMKIVEKLPDHKKEGTIYFEWKRDPEPHWNKVYYDGSQQTQKGLDIIDNFIFAPTIRKIKRSTKK